MRAEIRLARRPSEVVACQYLIADIYHRRYGVVFSKDGADPAAKIEPYPHRYAVCAAEGRIIAAVGLYVRDTYVERFGGVTREDIRRVLEEAGRLDCIDRPRHEYTRLVVHPDWEGKGIGRSFFALIHSRDFICAGEETTPLLLVCAKRSIFANLVSAVGVRSRLLRPFPDYRAHEQYRTLVDPMESRLIIPDLDINPRWYNQRLPVVVEIEQ